MPSKKKKKTSHLKLVVDNRTSIERAIDGERARKKREAEDRKKNNKKVLRQLEKERRFNEL